MSTFNLIEEFTRPLGITTVEYVPSQSNLLVDTHDTASMNLRKVFDNIPKELQLDIFKKLLLCWIIKSKCCGPFELGVTQSGETIPLVLKEPFNNPLCRDWYNWDGLVVTPSNMILILKNEDYISVAYDICKYVGVFLGDNMCNLFDSFESAVVLFNSYRELNEVLRVYENNMYNVRSVDNG